ncbi:hypothetical protein EAE99_004254 [Botrytis elliptica]|nr:hypothetical protein EAE99_004254 [Botrytis elliptica]
MAASQSPLVRTRPSICLVQKVLIAKSKWFPEISYHAHGARSFPFLHTIYRVYHINEIRFEILFALRGREDGKKRIPIQLPDSKHHDQAFIYKGWALLTYTGRCERPPS